MTLLSVFHAKKVRKNLDGLGVSSHYIVIMYSEILALAVLLVSCAQGKVYLGDLPMQNPDLFEGDILGIEDPSDRNLVPGENKRWPNGIVPYEIDPSLKTFNMSGLFWATFYYYKRDTCIRFVERTNETDYIRFFKGQGCYSNIGRTGGAQPLSLGAGCEWMGAMIHEIGHALGFYHEQNRSDRDDYLIIYWDNIKEGMADQFIKLKPHQNILMNEFDYASIMLYGEYTFSKERGKLPTMAAKKAGVKLYDVVNKINLSKSDAWRINKLYNCKM